MRLLESPDAVGEVVNVGGIEEISMLELAHRIRKKVGCNAQPQLVPYDHVFGHDFEDMQRRVPSTAKLRALTDFSPCTGLDEILEDVVSHYRASNPAAPRLLARANSNHAATDPFGDELETTYLMRHSE